MVLKDGWLNRQMDQVSKNVDTWPDWMKRAGGFEANESKESSTQDSVAPDEGSLQNDQSQTQRKLNL